MIPLCKPYNDARRNLIGALLFAARGPHPRPQPATALCCPISQLSHLFRREPHGPGGDFYAGDHPEVCLFFDGKLLRGNRSTKVNSAGLSAFDSPNFQPLAELSVNLTGARSIGTRRPPMHTATLSAAIAFAVCCSHRATTRAGRSADGSGVQRCIGRAVTAGTPQTTGTSCCRRRHGRSNARSAWTREWWSVPAPPQCCCPPVFAPVCVCDCPSGAAAVAAAAAAAAA